MPLSGLNSPSVRPRGGVAKVELVPAPLWAGSVPAATGAWAFREDRAHYSETPAGDNPLMPLVRHTLVVELPATRDSRLAADELAAVSDQGIVAVVTMASGEVIVAGYSSRFGTGYPMRMIKRDIVSGRTPADFPTVTVILESVDADYSSTPG